MTTTPPPPPTGDSNSLIFQGEISKLCDVSQSTVSNWVKRYPDFPKPLHQFRRSLVYSRHDILTWLWSHGRTS